MITLTPKPIAFPAPPVDRFPILEIDKPWLTVNCVWPFTEFSGRMIYEKVDGDKRPYLFEAAVDIDTGRWRVPTVSACDPTNENDFEDRDGTGIAGARRPRQITGLPKGSRKDLHARALLAAQTLHAQILAQEKWLLELFKKARPVDVVARNSGKSILGQCAVRDDWLIVRRDTRRGLEAYARRLDPDGNTSDWIVRYPGAAP